MRRVLFAVLLFLLVAIPSQAQGPGTTIFLPIVWKGGGMASTSDAILRITDGTRTVDLLGSDGGFKLDDPYWRPAIAQLKGGGDYADSRLAPGRRLVSAEYNNVTESFPLIASGKDQDKAIRSIREALQLMRQASDYWTTPYEYDDVWIEVRPACDDCLTGYARAIKGSIPELDNVFGQPFYSGMNEAVMRGLTLLVEREPFWRGTEPGEIIGPLYNLLRNPDFELWNFGAGDSQPDSWDDIEVAGVVGTNNRQDVAPKWGDHALRVDVTGSIAVNDTKGVHQTVTGTRNGMTYTVLAWVRNDGITNGVGRILITYGLKQLELYRGAVMHGWTLYADTFTTGVGDVVGFNCEILVTGANTVGTVYFDSLMLLEGDWTTEAQNGTLPYMSSSHIVNHWDQPTGIIDEGDINWVDAWNVPGDVPALVRLEVLNNSEPTDSADPAEIYNSVRIGQRRIWNVLIFDNYHDPVGVADNACSSDDRINFTPTVDWTDITTQTIVGGVTALSNEGRFRVFCRVYDAKAGGDPTLELRLRYWLGTEAVNVKTLKGVKVPVRAQWTAVNLTPNAAMIFDAKFNADPPGTLGYTIQARRPTGAGDARLDHCLALPTDGGYFQAIIDPALRYQNSLVLDSTASITIAAESLRSGWTRIFAPAGGLNARALKFFKGHLYVSIETAALPMMIYRYSNNVFTPVLTSAIANGYCDEMEIYHEKLYVSQHDLGGGGQARIYSTSDGISWTQEVTLGVEQIFGLKSFDGYLWISAFDLAGLTGYIYSWDGTALVQRYTRAGAGNTLTVCSNALYGSIGSDVIEYSPVTGIWQIIGSTTFLARTLGTFEGKVYVGGGPWWSEPLWSYDGTVLHQVFNTPEIRDWYALQEYNGRFYAGGEGGGTAPVFVTDDGVTWTAVYDPSGFTTQDFTVGEGLLYMAAGFGGAEVYVYTEDAVRYSIPDFQTSGGFPTAPNRDLPNIPHRHRWVFSYDREDFVNAKDDAALVGIGYVPRYLSLRGHD